MVKIFTAGKKIETASKVLIMLHGRGGDAENILSLKENLHVIDFAIIAPQAENNSWYPQSFLAPPDKNEPWLSSSLAGIKDLIITINKKNISNENIFFLGFSQGACLTLEFVARNASQYGGVVAFTGGLIGDKIYKENYKGDFQQTPFFIGCGDPDPHVPAERVNETAILLKTMGAVVTEKIYKNIGHTIIADEINQANTLIFNR